MANQRKNDLRKTKEVLREGNNTSVEPKVATKKTQTLPPIATTSRVKTRSAGGMIKRTEKSTLQQEQIEQPRQQRAKRQAQRDDETNKENEELEKRSVSGHAPIKVTHKSTRRVVSESESDTSDRGNESEQASENASDDEVVQQVRPRSYTVPEKIMFSGAFNEDEISNTHYHQPKSAFSGRSVASSLTMRHHRSESHDFQPQYHTSPLIRSRSQLNSPSDTETEQMPITSTDASRKRSRDADDETILGTNVGFEELQTAEGVCTPIKKFKKLRTKDLSEDDKEVTNQAIEEFQVRICTEYAFPEHNRSELKLMALDCWKNACERYEVDIPMTTLTSQLITSRVSTIRGRIKDKVVAKVAGKYGFLESPDDEDINANKTLAQKLLKSFNYIYKDPNNSRGMYEHPIVADVIAHQFFSKRARSTGIEYSAAFNTIPDPLIALVFTAVHFAISQWEDGTFTAGGSFKESEYHIIYKRHLDGLKKWRAFNENSGKALAQHQQKLYDYGSQRAGFRSRAKTPLDDPFGPDRLAQAAAALEEI